MSHLKGISGSHGLSKEKGAITLQEVAEELEAEVLCNHHSLGSEVEMVAAGDLMSDLLRIPYDGVVLLTGLNSIQSVRTCVLTNMKALILVRGKKPGEGVLEEALDHGLPIMTTALSLFTSCGRLYARGLKGIP